MKREEYGSFHGLIKCWRNPYDLGFSTTRPRAIQFEPGLTVLVGCNGTGKSTLLKNIQFYCEQDNVPCLKYDNLKETRSNKMNKLLFYGEMDLLAAMATSSEGESIRLNLEQFARKLGTEINHTYSDASEIWVLFDATDSGFSIDNIAELKSQLFPLLTQEEKQIYLLVAANSYEMARGERCMDVMSGKILHFTDYEDYRSFILKSRKRKDDRFERAFERRRKEQEKQ